MENSPNLNVGFCVNINRTTLLILLLFIAHSAIAQKSISGKVLDESNTPVLGASVLIKEKNVGTQTDIDGNFILTVSEGDIINVSYLGYVTQNITVDQRKNYTIVLEVDVNSLDEIVIVGYGQQKKAILTSSVSIVKGENLVKQPVPNVTQALQGQAAGVNIIASDAPGQASTVIIRGLGTVQSGRDPLYVVDGVLTTNINNINSADIESLSILKDAASLAIYGNRGANGVVIVTTKKGKIGEFKISVDAYSGIRDILTRVELANSSQFVTYSNEALRRTRLLDNDPSNDNSTLGFIPTNQAFDTDWLEVITQIGTLNNVNISVSGGSEQVNAFFSASFNEERGILLNDKFNRLTVRSNVDYKISEKLRFSHNVSAQLSAASPQNFNLFTDAYKQAPIIPVRDENGDFGSAISINNVANPAIDASNEFKEDRNKFFRLQGAFKFDYDIIESLSFTSRFSIETETARFYAFRDRLGDFLARDPSNTESSFEAGVENRAFTRLSVTNSNTYRWFLDNYFTFNKTINDLHTFNVTLGISADENGGEFLSATRNNVPRDSNLNFNINLGDNDDTQLNAGTRFETRRTSSLIARLNYDYNDKYLFGGSFRRDGSSQFQQGNRIGNFFALSAGWVLTEEDFLDDSIFDILKLRGSFGELGNQNVNLNVVTATSGSGAFFPFGPNQDLQQGITVDGTVDADLTWETTEEFNLGVEFTLLDYKFSGELDFYQRLNTNSILLVQLPTLTGLNPFNSNVGEIENRGIELALNWKDEINSKLKYSLAFNISYNENEFTRATNPFVEEQNGGFINNGQFTKRLSEGQALGSFYLFDIEGINDQGDLVFRDLNEDGVIDENDRGFFGSYLPKVFGGLNINIQYKNFDVDVDTYYNLGNQVYNGKKAQRFGNENIEVVDFNSRFTSARPSNTTPRAFNEVPLSSTFYLEDGDFFRINNITIGYSIPTKEDSFLNSLRFYVTARNPFIFQKFSGFTPELTGDPLGNGGIELDAFPTLRSFFIGLNTSF